MTKQSMTGFGKVEIAGENYTLSVEVKSVNHRFKDIRFKMPSMFNSKEMELKKILEKNFIRGSFEIYVSYKKAQGKIDVVDIDTKKVETYLAKMQEVGENLDVQKTIPRGNLWSAMTPQIFRYEVLKQALEAAIMAGESVTDEASAIEAIGLTPRIIQGEKTNIKITHPSDMVLAESIINTLMSK